MLRIVRAAMALGDLGLLTHVSPQLVSHLYPYNVMPALVAQALLTLWLLMFGIDSRHREQRAG